MLKNILLLIVSTILSLITAEVTSRMLGIQGNYMPPREDTIYVVSNEPQKQYGYIPNAIIRSRYPSNPRGYFDNRNSIDHQFNSSGYRDIEHSFNKSASTYRILGLGDSYLFGQGVKFDDICTTKLGQSRLENKFFKYIEVINTGVSGYNTGKERDLLLNVGLKYRPDLVIVSFVLNDVEDIWKDGPKINFFVDYLSIYQQPDTLSKYSQLWGWTRQKYLQRIVGKRYIDFCVTNYQQDSSRFKRVRGELLDIQRICAENKIKLLVVVFPFFYNLNNNYPFQIIHDQMNKACLEANIDMLDLLPYFKEYNGPELWVHPVDQHPNEIAHGIAANAISKYLLENNFLGIPRT